LEEVVLLLHLFTHYFNMKIPKNNAVKTVLIISTGFGFIFFLFDLEWALYTSLIIGALGVISNNASKAIDFLWMRLAKVLSLIVPNILLSIIFYLLLFPIAVLSKIFGANYTLQLKNSSETVWVDNNTEIDKASFEKMW